MIEEYDNVILEDLKINLKYEKRLWSSSISEYLCGGLPLQSTDKISTVQIIERLASWVLEEHLDPILIRGDPKRLTLRENKNISYRDF